MLMRLAFLREIAHNTQASLQAIAKPGHLLQAASNELPSNNALAIKYCVRLPFQCDFRRPMWARQSLIWPKRMLSGSCSLRVLILQPAS